MSQRSRKQRGAKSKSAKPKSAKPKLAKSRDAKSQDSSGNSPSSALGSMRIVAIVLVTVVGGWLVISDQFFQPGDEANDLPKPIPRVVIGDEADSNLKIGSPSADSQATNSNTTDANAAGSATVVQGADARDGQSSGSASRDSSSRDSSSRGDAEPTADAGPDSAGIQPLSTLSALKENRFDAVVRDVARREDPLVDGWQSEQFNDLSDAQFKTVGKLLSGESPADTEHLLAVAMPDVTVEYLRPDDSQFERVYEDSAVSVLRDASGPVAAGGDSDSDLVGADNSKTARKMPSNSGLDAFRQAIERQADLFAGMSDVRFKFKTIRVDKTESGFTTRSFFQMSGRSERESAQANSIWIASWQGSVDPPRLESLRVENYEEIHLTAADGSLFADCTESVFGNSDRFSRQLIHGLDYWTDRFDGAIARRAAGHGLAIGDVNGDGLEDVYVCQSPGLPNLLLMQNADGTVTDRAVEAGVNWLEGTRAALLVDLDNDGDPDLVAALGSKVVIQENDGSGVFRLRAIVDSASSLFAMNAVDYDNDNDLDVYICGYTLVAGIDAKNVFANAMPFQDANNGAPNVLLRNDGGWNFSDVTKQAGLDVNNMRFSYASAWDDYDNDGDQDLYVANDFGRNNLFRNEGGHFTDVAGEQNVEDIGPGMSISWGDYNNDAIPDLYVSNMFSSAGNRITHQNQFQTEMDAETRGHFQRHARGNSLFAGVVESTGRHAGFDDQSVEMGVTLGRWAWGSLLVDINNDGWQDIYVTNGFMTADDTGDL